MPVEIDFPGKNSDSSMDAIGSANGLVCLCVSKYSNGTRQDLFLWNPFTRTSRKLPKCDMDEFLTYDFLYDESNNDFKLIAVAEYGCMSVYSLKYDGWRLIKDFNFVVEYRGVYANGAVYWAAVANCEDYDSDDSLNSIASLDMNTETCREVLLPNYEEGANDIWYLATCGNSLSDSSI